MLVRDFFGLVDLHRDEKFVSLRFRSPFKVISTSAAHGGLREGLDLVFNHQVCEARFHEMPGLLAAHRDAARYSEAMMRRHGLAGSRAAGLGTAADMNTLCLAEASHRDLSVVALATGGVETNAARAGDPASYYEYDGIFEKRGDLGPDAHGTINVIVLINTPVVDGSLVRAVMTATEGKTAALQELSVPSRQSDGLATGTGTDQIAVAAPVSGVAPLTSAGHHSVLGEMIGRTVHDAVKQALGYQNRLTAVAQGSVGRLLERFGMDAVGFSTAVTAALSGDAAALAAENGPAIDHEPLTVAGVAALLHVRDQVTWGMVPPLCWREAAVDHGALIASAAAGLPARMAVFRETLARIVTDEGRDDPPFIAVRAVALGYAEKWRSTEAMLAAVTAEDAPEAAQ